MTGDAESHRAADSASRRAAPGQPRRVRVSADDPASAEPHATSGIALPGAPVHEADTVFLHGLMRAQLRLAAGCLVGFLLVSLVFTAAIFVIARTADPIVVGVPLSWLLQAYGYYPIIFVFAILFARSAARNERRYRLLAGADEERT